MDPPNQHRDEGDDDNNGDGADYCFTDAQDDFPFHDCSASDLSVTSTSSSTITEPSPAVTSPHYTLRRRSKVSGSGHEDSIRDSSSAGSISSQIYESRRRNRGKRYKFYRDLKVDNENIQGTESTGWNKDQVVDVVGDDDEKKEESVVTTAADDRVNDSVDSTVALDDSGSPNLLTLVAGLVIKAIGFQFSLFICFITYPLWVLYHCYMLVVDPFGVARRSRGFLMLKLVSLWNLIGKSFSSLMGNWLMDQTSLWELLLRVGRGLFWSIYVGIVLCGLFVMAIMASGFLVRCLVEEPMQLREHMNFDYTKPSPVAFVPIMSCDELGCGENCKDGGMVDAMSLRPRAISRNHKLQVRVLLTLPESEYNRNLGIFQVRVDFLSADGKTLASKSQPSMLKFRSDPIRLLLTLLEIVPLIAGYVSESQNLELKIRGFTEGDVPTSCLKVTMEQRAVFQSGAGIPEIYDASLVLESGLPLFKRIIWYWRKTLFIWIAISAFITELVFTLICCRPLIIPKVRLRDGSTINNIPGRG